MLEGFVGKGRLGRVSDYSEYCELRAPDCLFECLSGEDFGSAVREEFSQCGLAAAATRARISAGVRPDQSSMAMSFRLSGVRFGHDLAIGDEADKVGQSARDAGLA